MRQEFDTLQRVYESAVAFLVNYSFQLVGAMLILAAGFIVARAAGQAVLRLQERRNVDVTLRQFIASTTRLVVIAMFAIVAVAKLGISITPLIAAVGGLAVGASFALQGPVSNYGAGLVIILTRMFKVGDTITVQGYSGVVEEITLALTRLSAEDGEDIVIPNKHVVGEIHRNSYHRHIVEGECGIPYGGDPLRAVTVIEQTLGESAAVCSEPAPQVGVDAFRATSICVGYRYWVPTRRLYEIRHSINAALIQNFAAAGIELLAQREVLLVSPPVHNPT